METKKLEEYIEFKENIIDYSESRGIKTDQAFEYLFILMRQIEDESNIPKEKSIFRLTGVKDE